jgi:UDP-N-acetylmuramoyl-tripeptide--D-alanyl-D-alanine ligase
MAAFSIQELVRATEGALVSGDLGVPVAGVSIDSRTLQVGEAFFAIVGHRLDGHAFLADAAARGAACVVVHTLPDEPPANVPLVLVEDTTRSLGRLAAWHRSRFSVPVVGITGSIGKTTAKELTAAVLATRWNVLKPASSFNNQWGLPLTLLRLGAEHGAAVVEIGTNQAGEIATLSAIAQPTVGVVTMVAAVHTEFLGSIEGVREEKAALVRALAPSGIAVLNADDARVASMAREAKGRVVTFGRAAGAGARIAGDATDTDDGFAFTLEVGGRRQAVSVAFAGRHNVANALAAAAVGVALDLPLDEIARGLAAARPVGGRGVWKRAGEVTILDDTYNASPASVRAALDTLAARRAGRRAVVVLGDMLELGTLSDAAHR